MAHASFPTHDCTTTRNTNEKITKRLIGEQRRPFDFCLFKLFKQLNSDLKIISTNDYEMKNMNSIRIQTSFCISKWSNEERFTNIYCPILRNQPQLELTIWDSSAFRKKYNKN